MPLLDPSISRRSPWPRLPTAPGIRYLRQYASEAKAWGHPFFLRFASEMNGSWVSWSERHSGNSAGQFVQAWRHVHDIFTSVGATNVTWVWCPNTENAYTTPLEDLYPGNAYVDWAGIDGYNFSTDLDGAPVAIVLDRSSVKPTTIFSN